jgi:hypothetical protein
MLAEIVLAVLVSLGILAAVGLGLYVGYQVLLELGEAL